FNDCLSDNDVYTDLLESARNGRMSQFLLDLGEDKLANRIETIDCKLCDHDYMSQLSLIIIGEPTSIEKVAYYDCFTITNVKCVDIGNKILVSIYIKILSHINEEYIIKIKSNFGENKFVFNPTLFEEGRTITREQEIDKVSYEPFVGTLEVDNNPLTISIECNSNRIIHVKDDVYISMVHVKGGSFWMGRGGDSNHNDALVHHVSLSDFYIAETQVTQKLWEAVMENNPSLMKGEEFPVESVNWIECQKFLTELNNLTRLQFRLPTEAEWEFAARGGRKSLSLGFTFSSSA
ncbi:MAG: SUMF1/EgtB/PvdO family nonheme iron enzyme, partial [Alistipes sp.]|nr:SUMF1/EgtB/PvdO family nonheme iron enzyme [Alistipes sp.]